LRDKYPDLNAILARRQRKLMRLLEKVMGPTEGKLEPTQVKTFAVSAPELSPNSASSSSPRKPGRNDPCPCGSGKKYKKCCGRN
jgi:preprotein translocase subunit SecA